MYLLQNIGGKILMSNIKKVFEKGKTLIPFITCGDPSIAITEELIYTMGLLLLEACLIPMRCLSGCAS